MRIRIEGKLGKKKQFVERDFEGAKDQTPLQAAEIYAEEYCGSWKKVKITEV